MGEKELCTLSETARRLGIDWTSLKYAVKTGRVSYIEQDGVKLFDPELAKKQFEENTDKTKQGRRKAKEKNLAKKKAKQLAESEPDFSEIEAPFSDDDEEADEEATESWSDARAMKEKYAAKIAKLEFRKRAGQLIEAEAVKREAFKLGRVVRDSMLHIPERISYELAAETDAHRIHVLLTNEIHKALEALTPGRLRQSPAPKDGDDSKSA